MAKFVNPINNNLVTLVFTIATFILRLLWHMDSEHYKAVHDLPQIIWLKMCFDTAYFVENWKYYCKIIFKCVNNAVASIFNENFVEKRGL